MHIHQQFYGVTLSGATASLFTMKNDNGVTVAITDFGGTIVNLITPDRNGKMLDVVMGYDSLRDYETADGYLGFDGNMREVVLWDANGQWKGAADDGDLFGTDYPWFCASDLLPDGGLLTVMTETREDESAMELVAFTVKGF